MCEQRIVVRKIVLPSGKTVQITYYEDVEARQEPQPAQKNYSGLHICGSCGSHLVYPTAWEEFDQSHREVSLRCPNCESTATGIFSQEDVDRFDEELDRGTETLVGNLKHMSILNFKEDVERFTFALDCNHILPEDF